jgi:uncharacterized protein DUF6529
MEDLVESLMRDNVTEVKVMLASVATALAVYQLVLIAVGYGKLRLPFLAGRTASTAHRTIGDVIALLLIVVGVACLSVYGFDDDATAHVLAGSALLVVLTVKVAVVRRGLGLGRALPLLGGTVFTLLAVTWATSAGTYLGGS